LIAAKRPALSLTLRLMLELKESREH
jgi:hypothetical protein